MQSASQGQPPKGKSEPDQPASGSTIPALLAHSAAVEPERIAGVLIRPETITGKPSCPGYWEIMVELGDTYERCILCGERREIGG